MGLGKHLPAVIARRLATPGESVPTARAGRPTSSPFSALKAWQCNLRNVAGQFRGIQSSASSRRIKDLSFTPMIVRLYHKNRGNSDNWLDVGWGKEINRQFEVSIKLMVTNQRGVLARVAAAIAEAGSNIDNVGMEGDGAYTTMTFMLQVRNRHHLAQVMRNLRRIP